MAVGAECRYPTRMVGSAIGESSGVMPLKVRLTITTDKPECAGQPLIVRSCGDRSRRADSTISRVDFADAAVSPTYLRHAEKVGDHVRVSRRGTTSFKT
jgi:hypothetical protein